MSFLNENPDEERRLRAVLRQAPIPDTPSAFGNLLNSRRRRRKVVAMLMSIAAGIFLALFFHKHWLPPRIECVEKSANARD